MARGSRSIWAAVLFIVFMLALGYVAGNLLDWAVLLGHYIPHKAIEADYVFAVIWAGVLGLSIWLWPVPRHDKRGLLFIWLAKCAVTLGFMLLYENQYGLDAYFYFDQSGQPGPIDWNFWQSKLAMGSQLIINLASLQHRVLPFSFHALKVSFAMVGLVAIYIFYRGAVIFLRREDIRALYALGLLPSILFWSSIIGKDPIVLLGIALYCYGVIGWQRCRRRRYMVALAVGVLMAMAIRLWLGPILLAPLAALAWWGIRGVGRKLGFLALTLAALWVSVEQVRNRFHVETTQDLVEATHQISHSWSYGGSGREVGDISDLTQILASAPTDAFTALFRPLPGDVDNLFGYLAGLENAGLLLVLFVAVLRTPWGEWRDPLVIWAILLVLTWSGVYGFVSAQNLGSAVRFKLQILPVLWGLLLYLSRRRPELKSPVQSSDGAGSDESADRQSVCAA